LGTDSVFRLILIAATALTPDYYTSNRILETMATESNKKKILKSVLSSEGPFTFGLDIGIASVGWAVLSKHRIVDLGVRCFDKAETAKEGKSLNLARRTARLTRRRLWNRAWRLTKLARLLKHEGLTESADLFKNQPGFTKSVEADSGKFTQTSQSPWLLRVEALDRKLTNKEWARVIYHLCKHRGFYWVSKAEEASAEDGKESGKVKAGLAHTQKLMGEKNYRTAAEMILTEFPDNARNKQGDYGRALSRILLGEEFTKLFIAQRIYGNEFAGEALQQKLLGSGDRKTGLFWEQKPLQSVLHMLGKCTFERQEFRAPKASFTAEQHVWLTRLNNLRIIEAGQGNALNEAQRSAALWLPYLAGDRFTYKQFKTALSKLGLLSLTAKFAGLSYPGDAGPSAAKEKDPEDQPIVKLTGWHTLKALFKKHGLDEVWKQISTDAIDGKADLYNSITWVLSVYKSDEEILEQLNTLSLPNHARAVDALLGCRFDKFHALSLKALRKIVPEMQSGLRYDEAIAKIPEYGHHSQLFQIGGGSNKYLPPFYEQSRKYNGKTDRIGSMQFRTDIDIPRNPVVLRALNQARKIVNALIVEYGSPHSVNIEMARDLSRPLDERRDVQKLQDEYRDRNDKARLQFEEDFERKPTGKEFEKLTLYREQQGKCLYSLATLDIQRVINEPDYVQIDHALPYSRSYDDSKNNKVLVLTAENQNKGNRTPFEYLTTFNDGELGDRWRSYAAYVEGNKSYRLAKRTRLLRKAFGKDEASAFREKNLNDTRYICKFFKNYVEQYLQLASGSDAKRCVVLNGQLTAFLRARWGLTKRREESDRHHALDAVVVAACTHSMVKQLSDYSRKKEIEFLKSGFPDPETGEILNLKAAQLLEKKFPTPWVNFRNELEIRLKTDDLLHLRTALKDFPAYDENSIALLRPLFVSRAPQRRSIGAAHKETVYAKAATHEAKNRVTEKVALSKLTLKDLDRLVDPQRNEKLYAAIRSRLEDYIANGGKFSDAGNKAFPADKPLYKPDKSGQPLGPMVRSVVLAIDKLTGVGLRGGVASNDSMIRVDVFRSKKDLKFHLVPVYVHHMVSGLPNLAIVQAKDESEWTLMNEDFEFLFALYSNDLVRLHQKGKSEFVGYYRGCHSGTGSVSISHHDRDIHGVDSVSKKQLDKDPAAKIKSDKYGLIEGLGVKTAVSFSKLNVDLLGNVYSPQMETRRGLA
jgi:CRISPR-associated endonuclease Csn1